MSLSTYRTPLVLFAFCAFLVSGCSDSSEPPVPGTLHVLAGDGQTAEVGTAVPVPPSVRVLSTRNKPMSGVPVDFTASANGQVNPSRVTTDADGVATLTSWTLPTQPGSHTLTASTPGVSDVVLTATAIVPNPVCTTPIHLGALPPGELMRWPASAQDAPVCINFLRATSSGEFLIQFENLSMSGNSDTGLFPGFAPVSSFVLTVQSGGLPQQGQLLQPRAAALPAQAVSVWDFGAGPIYEIEPPAPPAGTANAVLLRGGVRLDAAATRRLAAVGDTLEVRMEGIPRLNISTGNQRAIVKYVGPHFIIAEDIRLGELTREGGGLNAPLTQSDMEAIAAEYAQYALVQSDLFFDNRYNAAIEANENRPIAVHSLMYANNIWGYTYPSGNYFIFDYWVATDGSTRGPNQSTQRVAGNLFIHEIAHMRHFGLQERAGLAFQRGNRWLVEGFARATERWPVAMELLGAADFSRTNNVVLPLFQSPRLNSLEDIPVYTQASASLYGGYAASSYVFDYFADQVALAGGDWRAALREFVTYGGVQEELQKVLDRHLPGVDVGTLFTRARIALMLDDYASGLPAWTQFHQYQLRASRQTQNPQLDPRNLWPRIVPGHVFAHNLNIPPGGAFGYLIDGTSATGDARITLNYPRTQNGVVSIMRIR